MILLSCVTEEKGWGGVGGDYKHTHKLSHTLSSVPVTRTPTDTTNKRTAPRTSTQSGSGSPAGRSPQHRSARTRTLKWGGDGEVNCTLGGAAAAQWRQWCCAVLWGGVGRRRGVCASPASALPDCGQHALYSTATVVLSFIPGPALLIIVAGSRGRPNKKRSWGAGDWARGGEKEGTTAATRSKKVRRHYKFRATVRVACSPVQSGSGEGWSGDEAGDRRAAASFSSRQVKSRLVEARPPATHCC